MGSVVWGGGDGSRPPNDPPGWGRVIGFVVIMSVVWLVLVWAFLR